VIGILELREKHATWGPDKISRVLVRTLGTNAPSKSTVARVLQRAGRIRRRRPRVRLWTVEGRPYVEVVRYDPAAIRAWALQRTAHGQGRQAEE